MDWLIPTTADFDVRLGRNERNAVISEPLFFCPNAGDVASDCSLGVSTIQKKVAAAQVDGVVNRADTVGKNVVENVLNCRPTSFARVVNTINVINYILIKDRGAAPLLTSSMIIGAVFRLPDLHAILTETRITEAALAAVAGVEAALVGSAARGYRLHFDAAHRIASALPKIDAFKASGWNERRPKKGWRGPIVVDREGRRFVEKLDKGGTTFVLTADNLTPAPRSGHDWALDL